VPYIPEGLSELQDAIENLKDPKTGQPRGYSVDFEQEIVIQKSVSSQGKPFERQIRLGKVIQELDYKWKDFYNRSGGTLKKLLNGYAIIVSRHPIDVVRMSDHNGIKSCHSPGNNYFKCAVSESKGQGPIAYLVKKSDLENIKDIYGAEEIFKDSDRGIKGIIPIARIRLRRFQDKVDNEKELAVPEIRAYGTSGSLKDQFLNSVTKWAYNAQQKVHDNKAPNMKEYERTGGSYADNSSSDLFNNMFGHHDVEYSGDTEYNGEDDYETLANQYEAEIEKYRAAHGGFENNIWADGTVQDADEGEPWVNVTGGAEFEFNTKDFIDPFFSTRQNWKVKRQIEEEIKKAIKELDFYNTESIEFIGDTVRLFIDADNEVNGPDNFRSLLDNLDELDEKYDQVKSAIYNVLVANNVLRPSNLTKAMNQWHPENQFKNFTWKSTNTNVNVVSRLIHVGNVEKYIGKPTTGFVGPLTSDVTSAFDTILQQSIQQYVRQARQISKQQMVLPGFHRPAFQPVARWPLGRIKAHLDVEAGNQVFAKIEFNMGFGDGNRDLQNAVSTVNFIDTNFEKITQMAERVWKQVTYKQMSATD